MNLSPAFLKIFIVASFIVLNLEAIAQETFAPATVPVVVKGTHILNELNVDGSFDEPEWFTADSISDFIQVEPLQGQPAKNKTIVRILFSDRNLYVGVWCYDSLGKAGIRVPDMKRDFDWRSHDTFAICIDGFNDRRNSMSFVTNPYGAQKDYLSFDAVLFDGDWNGLWKVRTSIDPSGWFAEFQIPFKTIRYSKAVDPGSLNSTWGLNFLRLRRATNEISVWSPYPRSFSFNRMEYAGLLNDILPPPPSTNIQINPYTMVSSSKRTDGAGSKQEDKFKVGGEVKWAVTPNTVMDLTVNTDFAQADADIQVNNVTRFSVLFPEKRQFFLENASLFGPGLLLGDSETGGSMQLLPFFSRRVGLGANGQPLPIDAGIRLANRSVKQNFGVMAIRTGSYDTLDNSNVAVGRYTRNFGKQNRIGVIGTAKSSNVYTNLVGGVDGFVRMGSSQSLNFMALQSTNTNNKGHGLGGYAQYFYTNNKIVAWWTESVVTKGFNPELGFLSRTDVIGTTPGAVANLRGKYLPFKKFFRSYQPRLAAGLFHQASTGKLTERELRATPLYIEMQDGGYYGFTASDVQQNLLSSFQPLGVPIAMGSYSYRRYSLVMGSDASRKVSYKVQHDFGKYYDGSLTTTDVSLSLIPIPHISLKLSANRNVFENVGELDVTKAVSLYTIQGRFALNPRLQLTGIYQRNSQSDLDSFNIRFSWEYKPLSYIYLVLNSRETIATESMRQTEQQGIFKISFLKQF